MNQEELFESLLRSVREFNRCMRPAKHMEFELKPPELFMLHHISQNTHVRPSDLAKCLGFAPSTMTPLIDGLVHKNYIIREVSQKDRRAYDLRLSPKGEELAKRGREAMFGGLRNVIDQMEASELLELIRLLSKATDILESIERE